MITWADIQAEIKDVHDRKIREGELRASEAELQKRELPGFGCRSTVKGVEAWK